LVSSQTPEIVFWGQASLLSWQTSFLRLPGKAGVAVFPTYNEYKAKTPRTKIPVFIAEPV